MLFKRLSLLLGGATLALGASLMLSDVASAANAADFQPGRIIDDAIFNDGNAMSVTDIQNFLADILDGTANNGANVACDTAGNKPYYGTYGGVTYTGNILRKNLDPTHYPAPYVCLKDYYENPTTHENNLTKADLLPATVPSGGISAAQIIYNAAQAYSINPKVLIVMIQKESSGPLLTDDWPWYPQYKTVMGYGCPDTAACDSTYFGFYNQVWNAARQFRIYANNPTSYNYAVGLNNIKYNPNAACGTKPVTIVNQATASLYIYTPYTPNAAALANLYGTGDACSTYGNRNFWRMFTDWFGSTLAPTYAWDLQSEQAFTDATKTTGSSLQSLLPGQKAYLSIAIRNRGNATWTNTGPNPLRLGTSSPLERKSVFCDTTWLSCSRPATLNEASVAPGQTGTFEFWIKAPAQAGSYKEYFTPLIEGVTWLPDIGLFYGINVQQPSYTWQMTSQYAYTDATKTTSKNMATMLPGEKAYVGFTAKNTGNVTWTSSGANSTYVGTLSPYERRSAFSTGSSWLSNTRPATMKEASVAPGQIGTFEFWMTAPLSAGGIYNERFGLVVEGITWLNDVGLSYYANVQQPSYTWQMTSQYAYTDATKTTPKNMALMAPGEKTYVGFTAKNTGNVPWTNTGTNSIHVGTLSPFERQSAFSNGSSWLSSTRPATMKEASVAPGQTGTFEFWMTAPLNANGVYNERFGLLDEGITWLNDVGLSYYANVH